MRQLGRAVFITVVFLVLLLIAVTWLLSSDHSLDHLKKAGVIRVGYAVEAPYAFLTPDGKVTGESPELAKWIVAKLEIPEIEWRQTEFSNLITELESKRIDLIAAGMFITRQRAERVSFSEPVFHVRQGLLVSKGNPLDLHSYEQFVKKTGARIAVLSGSVEEVLLRNLGLSSSQVVVVPDALTGRVTIESGLADGLALSSVTVQWMAIRAQLGRTEAAQPFQETLQGDVERLGYGAFAFRKGDRQLLSAWNHFLGILIESEEHLQIVSQFGFTQAEMPGMVTTSEVLQK
jgi:polar amino acid transport system substrate-binding protein